MRKTNTNIQQPLPRRVNSSVKQQSRQVEFTEDDFDFNPIEDKLKNLFKSHEEKLNTLLVDKNKEYEDRLNLLTTDLQNILTAKNKEYEKQYRLLEDKYNKLRNLHEAQFFKFTSIISSYQFLIYKLNTASIQTDEYKHMEELLKNMSVPQKKNTLQENIIVNPKISGRARVEPSEEILTDDN